MNKLLVIAATLFVVLCFSKQALCEEANVLNLTDYKDEAALKEHEKSVSTVRLRGKVSLAAYGDFHAVVPGAHVWIAEYPESKELKIRSGKNGWWSMTVIKPRGTNLGFSFVYEKKGWITTKSNVISITDKDDLDLSMQFIDPQLFSSLAKPEIEKMLAAMLPAGSDTKFKNAIVVTVGKSWASMHDDRLPHGEAGAIATTIPGAVGPIYFDETVRPNPSYTKTSVDGGVAWINVPPGEYTLTATKPDTVFNDVKFVIDDADFASGIILHIASPPDTILSNDSTNP